ncbi:MAG: DUF2721 domain-containing protein [Bacteroidota bacterium]
MNQSLSDHITVIQVIQLILAPAVMISACGLLLLGISSKFSTILNRIRILNEEKRKLLHQAGKQELQTADNQRLESITKQIGRLLSRARLVRNSLFCYFLAVGLFVVTSLLIGLDFFVNVLPIRYFIIASFLTGMVTMFFGVVFGVLDTLKGFEVVRFEVNVDE